MMLWVRECFSYREYDPELIENLDPLAWYWADGNIPNVIANFSKPKPSIHMPRALSRLTLRLTDVRVERAQSISVADILSEGVILPADDAGHIAAWASLWDDTNGPGAFERNDWTWALTFEVLRENVDAVLARAKEAAEGDDFRSFMDIGGSA